MERDVLVLMRCIYRANRAQEKTTFLNEFLDNFEILKNDWNMFENETTNISVHISDYYPNLSLKNSKNDTEIYKLLKPKLFNNLFVTFSYIC